MTKSAPRSEAERILAIVESMTSEMGHFSGCTAAEHHDGCPEDGTACTEHPRDVDRCQLCALLDVRDFLATPAGGLGLIAAERRRQFAEEGWTTEHDDQHWAGELATAAACYAVQADKGEHQAAHVVTGRELFDRDHVPRRFVFGQDAWPWDPEWDKRLKHPKLRRLAIAGALIAAELDRLLRRKDPPRRQRRGELTDRKGA